MKLIPTDKDFFKQIPIQSGVYRFYDINSELLYVGKAVNLANRIKSYFSKTKNPNNSPRISLMVKKIDYIELTITENEISALILENNLIKSLKPKYNIVFRDDKSYTLIRISKHQFPKIDSYRGKTNDENIFFGPYPNSTAVKQMLDMIQRLFKIRTCTDTFFNNRSRPCMLHQINRCPAPCVKLINETEYKKNVDLAMKFLNGNYSDIINELTLKMNIFANNMQFESAGSVRDTIKLINQSGAKQIINNHNKPISADIIIDKIYNDSLFIYLITIRHGMYVGDNHFIIKNISKNDVVGNDQNLIEKFIENHYLDSKNTKLIYTKYTISNKFKTLILKAFNIRISNKMSGQLQKLHQMGINNLEQIIINSESQNLSKSNIFADAIQTLNNHLSTNIQRIECIDISHNHGDNTVASIVVYEDGIIDSSKYRRYNLSNSINGNDILAMETVLKKRIASSQESPLPDLFLIDGGKNQYNKVKTILLEYNESIEKDNNKLLNNKVEVISIFKGDNRNPKLDSVILNKDKIIAMQDDPIMFKLLQSLRDEAHRFAITGHRKMQQKKVITSILDDIPNIGKVKKRALINYFGSSKLIANATIIELQNVQGIGLTLAKQIYTYFHSNDKST